MLALLSEGPQYGLRLREEFEHRTGEVWPLKWARCTHDAQLASWADRVVFLRDGRVTDQTASAPGPESLLAPRDTR